MGSVVGVAVVGFGVIRAAEGIIFGLPVGRIGRGEGRLGAVVWAVRVVVGHDVLVRVEMVAHEAFAVCVGVDQGQPVVDAEDGRILAHLDC